jgi:2'-hydroxyisoflavone reductase
MTPRRTFVRQAAGGLALAGLGFPAILRRRPSSGLRILVLGGTGFTGPFQVQYAVARGHQVTVFNRGKRQTELPPAVEQLHGDRITGELSALKGKRWDVVIDVPTALPRWVRDAGEVLSKQADRYLFISTISVYGDPKGPPDESAPVDKWNRSEDPMSIRQFGAAYLEQYGALKALSEQEAERWFPGKTTVVRPGLIVGPGYEIDRVS